MEEVGVATGAMGSNDLFRSLDRALLIRRCVWILALAFFVLAWLTFPSGLGNLPLRGPDLWGYLVVRGEFRWVFLVALAIAVLLVAVGARLNEFVSDKYGYGSDKPDANDRE
jgi:Zn-dependent protease with chaperone function